MLGKLVSSGFTLATLPARLALRGAGALLPPPPLPVQQFLDELRGASAQAAQDMQQLLASVDQEMSRKTAHLSAADKQRVAEQALQAAEQHLSMAAINLLRGLWLLLDSKPQLPHAGAGRVLEHGE